MVRKKGKLNPVGFFNELINVNVIPISTEEAKKDKILFEAMKTECNSSVEYNVWKLVYNQEIKHNGSRWHFALKCGTSGEILGYKATSLAKRFSQVPGRDYSATFSPTTRHSTTRIL